MREIKFRLWSEDYRAWVSPFDFAIDGEGNLLFKTRDDGFAYEENDYFKLAVIAKGPFTLEQFTGLHDRNGREIYEGDILFCDTKFIVKWDDSHAMYKCFFVESDENYCNLSDSYIRDYFEVIGNIHENPELLNA